MSIANALIVTQDTTILTVPTDTSYAITTILVCNTFMPAPGPVSDEGLATFDLHIAKNGQAIGDQNMVVNTLTLPPGETFTFDTEKIVLDAGDYVAISSSSPLGVLSATISYLEV